MDQKRHRKSDTKGQPESTGIRNAPENHHAHKYILKKVTIYVQFVKSLLYVTKILNTLDILT
uniref:Uncharacterized protein n=1 Tax=Anguilla anguilla TaxID=7936 RepID=A0A0E9XB89_ANGAN